MAIGLAVNAFFRFFFRTMSLLDSLSLFNDDNVLFALFLYKLDSGEYPRRSCADYNYIGLHKAPSLSAARKHPDAPTYIISHKKCYVNDEDRN